MARGVGVVDRPVIPVPGLAIIGFAALLLANAVAAVPARRAARTPPALVLRAE